MMDEHLFVQTANWEQHPWANARIFSKQCVELYYKCFARVHSHRAFLICVHPSLELAPLWWYYTVQVQMEHRCSEGSWFYILRDLLLMTFGTRHISKLTNYGHAPIVARQQAAMVNAAQMEILLILNCKQISSTILCSVWPVRKQTLQVREVQFLYICKNYNL